MNVHFTLSGVGSAARQRALMLVRDAVVKREASLASVTADRPSTTAASTSNPLSSQGGR